MGTITWRKAGVYVLVALPVLGLAGIAVLARQQQDATQQSTGDPVADAARKARQQKKEAPKPKKVYTNEDVSSAPADSATSATATPATKAEDAAKGAQTEAGASPATDTEKTEKTGKTEKNDEATWRNRFKEARGKLAVAEKELDILQREVNKAQTQYYSDPAKAMSEQQNRTDIKDHTAKITAKKEEVAQLKQQISDLEDDLRRSGGDIGWARE
jgi:chromosome segregation ATPase